MSEILCVIEEKILKRWVSKKKPLSDPLKEKRYTGVENPTETENHLVLFEILLKSTHTYVSKYHRNIVIIYIYCTYVATELNSRIPCTRCKFSQAEKNYDNVYSNLHYIYSPTSDVFSWSLKYKDFLPSTQRRCRLVLCVGQELLLGEPTTSTVDFMIWAVSPLDRLQLVYIQAMFSHSCLFCFQYIR